LCRFVFCECAHQPAQVLEFFSVDDQVAWLRASGLFAEVGTLLRQNGRLLEAAEAYRQIEDYESAAAIYEELQQFERAANMLIERFRSLKVRRFSASLSLSLSLSLSRA
jgi:hypothetical protein